MLERHTSAAGVVFYASPLLRASGVPHAFSTRLGGVSPPPFDSMNLGNPNGCAVQDDYEHIWDNYRRLQDAARCGGGRELCRVHQIHGPAVVRATRGEPFDCAAKADALVTDDAARVLSVRVADCVPVLLATTDGRAVAAVHAGWRGTIAGVVAAAVDVVRGLPGGAGAPLVAAVGPCIGAGAFEVGPEVLAEFERVFGSDAPCRASGRSDGKGYVDLRAAVKMQLIRAGIAPERIDTTDRCTVRDAAEFFSHRRDNGATGRMAAIIATMAN